MLPSQIFFVLRGCFWNKNWQNSPHFSRTAKLSTRNNSIIDAAGKNDFCIRSCDFICATTQIAIIARIWWGSNKTNQSVLSSGRVRRSLSTRGSAISGALGIWYPIIFCTSKRHIWKKRIELAMISNWFLESNSTRIYH